MPGRRVLFVFTSTDKTLNGKPTGWFLSEAAHPYGVLAPHHTIDFASPAGPNPPPDPMGVKMAQDDPVSLEFLKDETVKAKLENAKKLSDVKASDYDAVFYVGGHGPLFDLAVDPVNIKLATDFYQAGKPVAAVCHGQAALVGVKDAQGKPIFEGKAVTCFSNAEENHIELTGEVPYLIEDKIVSLGGQYQKADQLFGGKVVVDGTLITGQNPASAKGVGEALLKAL